MGVGFSVLRPFFLLLPRIFSCSQKKERKKGPEKDLEKASKARKKAHTENRNTDVEKQNLTQLQTKYRHPNAGKP